MEVALGPHGFGEDHRLALSAFRRDFVKNRRQVQDQLLAFAVRTNAASEIAHSLDLHHLGRQLNRVDRLLHLTILALELLLLFFEGILEVVRHFRRCSFLLP